MGPTAVDLVAGVIDQIERAAAGTPGISGSRLWIDVAPSADGMGHNGPPAPCSCRADPHGALRPGSRRPGMGHRCG